MLKISAVNNCGIGKFSKKQNIQVSAPPIFGSRSLAIPQIDYFIKNKFPLTVFDSPEILELRQQCLRARKYTFSDCEYINNIGRILKEQFRLLNNAQSDKKMVIITGLPACGKSEYIKKNFNEDYFLADTDLVKKMFPAYADEGRKLNNLHEMSYQIMTGQIIPEVLKNGKNIIIPTTAYVLGINELASSAKKLGYNVKLIHMKVAKELCMKRAIERYHRGDKFIDPYFIEIRAPYMANLEENFTNSSLIDEIVVIKD